MMAIDGSFDVALLLAGLIGDRHEAFIAPESAPDGVKAIQSMMPRTIA
jgi:hypothetical protein